MSPDEPGLPGFQSRAALAGDGAKITDFSTKVFLSLPRCPDGTNEGSGSRST